MRKMLLITAMLGLSLMAIAGSVYGRKTVALSNSGQATIQIDPAYAGVALRRVWLLNSAGTQTITLKRVDVTGVYTQAICDVSSATNTTTAFTAAYLLPSDKIITSGGTTNATLQIEYEVQKH